MIRVLLGFLVLLGSLVVLLSWVRFLGSFGMSMLRFGWPIAYKNERPQRKVVACNEGWPYISLHRVYPATS